MMKESILRDKSKSLALRIVKLYKFLCEEKHEFVMSKQMLRSGTSIGANICEAMYAESEADFVHKLAIARKEAHETIYWLELLHESAFIEHEAPFQSLFAETEEILKLLTSSIKTLQKKTEKL